MKKLQITSYLQKGEKGYIALMTVLIISAVSLALGTTVALLSIGETQSSFALYQGEKTLNLVEGCMEDALLRVQKSSSYSGGTITQPEGTCAITVNKSGNDWTVQATNTTSTQYKRTIEIQFTRTGTITLTSWKEI